MNSADRLVVGVGNRGDLREVAGFQVSILHIIEAAKPGSGHVAVVVPHGVLFRGAAEGAIRREFIEENLLDCVIGLPANLFFSTGIPAAILLFDKGKKHKDTLFIDAKEHFAQGANQNKLRPEDIDLFVATHRVYKTVEEFASAPPSRKSGKTTTT